MYPFYIVLEDGGAGTANSKTEVPAYKVGDTVGYDITGHSPKHVPKLKITRNPKPGEGTVWVPDTHPDLEAQSVPQTASQRSVAPQVGHAMRSEQPSPNATGTPVHGATVGMCVKGALDIWLKTVAEQGGTWGAQEHNEGFLKWDTEARQEWIDAILGAGLPSVIWGGNYYDVPASRCWLIWNKVNAVPTMADFEMAWTNFDRPAKRIDLPVGRVEFGHPTQKPLALMLFCLQFVKAAQTILDPFTGSGTTGVACVREGKSFIGIEKDPAYFELACRRIEDAYAQPDFFIEPPAKPIQHEITL